MNISKKNVRTSEELQQYLQEQCQKSDRLYHYTSFESLICIIKNQSFRLSRMDLMNDRAEQKLGYHDAHLRNYIVSFTRDKEYVSMWAMYGKASGIKIRLDFSRLLFQKAINGNFYLDCEKQERIPLFSDKQPGSFYKKDYLISDVVYIDKATSELRHSENRFPAILATEDIIQDMTGFIKYDAWEFEREIRLRVLMRHDYRLNCDKTEIPRYIFAGINDDLIRDFHITFNPWISENMKEEIRNSLNRLSGFELSYSDSQNDGEITEL